MSIARQYGGIPADPIDKEKPMKKHPGFKAVASSIARKENLTRDQAAAILANSSRNASPAAKKANPALKRVKGK